MDNKNPNCGCEKSVCKCNKTAAGCTCGAKCACASRCACGSQCGCTKEQSSR